MATPYKHWREERDGDNIAWLTLDRADASVNTLSAEVLEELDRLLKDIAASPPAALVIRSGKANGFIAGADVREFTRFESEAEALAAVQRGHQLMNTLAALPFPTVAMIKGFCLGGGLELALACRHRVACDDPGTRLGLPEVRLGIHPGFGGTLRLIQLIGAPAALDAMLTGRSLSARAARRLGLVDHAVPERHLLTAARETALHPPRRKPLAWWKRLASAPWVRPWLGRYMARKVAARAPRNHYPAPYAIIDLWVQHYDNPARMLQEEAASIARLIVGRTARNLVRVFLLQEDLKGLARDSGFEPRHVHVVGAGVMGGDIASWCTLQGLTVTIQDRSHETLARAVQRAHDLFRKKLKKDRLGIQAAMDRFVPDPHGHGARRADLVIEAIFEDPEVKRELFRGLDPETRPEALIATNTSSIPLEELAPALKDPARLIGLHFFNPVAKMPLVEVVHGRPTARERVQQGAAFARCINRLPLPVTSTPGFLVNRILMPYLVEAVVLYEEGVPAPVIDKAAVEFGMPMGPIELADTVGLDICLHVAEILSRSMAIEVPAPLKQLVDQGRLGKKSGQGFYPFRKGKPVKPQVDRNYSPPADLQDRLMLRLLNEAVACLREKVVDSADHLDAGVIFGTGFAPFRGGPLHYIMTRGPAQLRQTLEKLQARHGDRFAPDPGWRELEAQATQQQEEEPA